MSGRRETILRLVEQGRSATEIALELGLARNTVYYHFRRLREERPVGSGRPTVPPPARWSVDTRKKVGELLAAGVSRAEIARRLGLSKPTVSYHARRLGRPVDGRCARRYDWAAVQAYYDAGHSIGECCEAFGFSRQTVHAAKRRGDLVTRPAAMPLSELLADGVPRARAHLKRRLLTEGLKRPQCERCGLTSWRGGPLPLDLHHANGRRHDNRLENLQLLCPNCHAQVEGERCAA